MTVDPAIVRVRRIKIYAYFVNAGSSSVYEFLSRNIDIVDIATNIPVVSKFGMVAQHVTQVIGEQALVDILDPFKVAWTCWGCFYTSSGLGLRMGKEIDLKLALGINERR